jgi:phosphotransferase system IIB component
MNILLSKTDAWLIYIGVIVGVIIILGLVFYFTCGLRSKREKSGKVEHVVVDELFIETLLSGLGGKDNIKNVSIDNGRVKFNIIDLDLLNQDAIKTVSTSGAFITGNNVKLLFKYDSEVIVNTLKERGIN